ncbi:hypothetical protein QJS66_21895 [Kocuria rhizophila]|nr:hypothetical protein QJS66_21895 [Kocuria rhizophila]
MMLVVGLITGIVGTVIGGLAGTSAVGSRPVLMRLTDVITDHPAGHHGRPAGCMAISWVRAHGLPSFATG